MPVPPITISTGYFLRSRDGHIVSIRHRGAAGSSWHVQWKVKKENFVNAPMEAPTVAIEAS